MLVNLDHFGRLGNRLFLDTHLTAFCWKHSLPLRNVAMDQYGADFPELQRLITPAWKFRARSYLPWSRHFRYWGDENLDFDKEDPEELLRPLKAGNTVYFHGWKFRGFTSVQRYRSKLLEKYRPSPATEQRAAQTLVDARRLGDVVVGVHIRWEDYRGTNAFLSQEEYCHRMLVVAEALQPRHVVFLVFSNEVVSPSGFESLTVRFPAGCPVEDLAAMSRCDYLMAPPSTFSGWASFYGGVPLQILARDVAVELEGFSVVRG